MEQADIQRLSNLADAIQKKVKWELDDTFRNLLKETINSKLITLTENTIYYRNYPLKVYRNIVDVIDWRNRKVGLNIHTYKLDGFRDRVITTLLRRKMIELDDELLVLSTMAHLALAEDQIEREYFIGSDYELKEKDDKVVDQLPTELRKHLVFYQGKTEVKKDEKEGAV